MKKIIILMLFINLQCAYAETFINKNQSVNSLSNAHAGTTVQLEDASVAFYNPAGLTALDKSQITVVATAVQPSYKLNVTSARDNNGNDLGAGITKPKSKVLLSALHAVKKINDKCAIGFSVTSPFSLKTNYNEDSITRFMATRTEIRTLDLSPNIAYQFNDKFSLGAGFDVIKTKYWWNVDYNSQWRYGAHVGLLFRPNDTTRMGFSYRSGVKTGIVKFPNIFTYSVYNSYSDKWSSMADIEYIKWRTSAIIPQCHRNTFRFAFGINYQYNEKLKFKSGLSFNQSPIKSKDQTIRNPIAHKLMIALGAKYQLNECVSLSAGYAHIFARTVTISETSLSGPQNLIGKFKTKDEIMGVQLTFNFV